MFISILKLYILMCVYVCAAFLRKPVLFFMFLLCQKYNDVLKLSIRRDS